MRAPRDDSARAERDQLSPADELLERVGGPLLANRRAHAEETAAEELYRHLHDFELRERKPPPGKNQWS